MKLVKCPPNVLYRELSGQAIGMDGLDSLWPARQVLCDIEPAATLQRLVWDISRQDSTTHTLCLFTIVLGGTLIFDDICACDCFHVFFSSYVPWRKVGYTAYWGMVINNKPAEL